MKKSGCSPSEMRAIRERFHKDFKKALEEAIEEVLNEISPEEEEEEEGGNDEEKWAIEGLKKGLDASSEDFRAKLMGEIITKRIMESVDMPMYKVQPVFLELCGHYFGPMRGVFLQEIQSWLNGQPVIGKKEEGKVWGINAYDNSVVPMDKDKLKSCYIPFRYRTKREAEIAKNLVTELDVHLY